MRNGTGGGIPASNTAALFKNLEPRCHVRRKELSENCQWVDECTVRLSSVLQLLTAYCFHGKRKALSKMSPV